MGKTTLSINLAHAFARAGVRTLLVDADPQGSVGLSLTRQSRLLSGFYDYLIDPGIPLDRLIVPTRLETFSLVTSGQASDYEAGGGMGAHLARVQPRHAREHVQKAGPERQPEQRPGSDRQDPCRTAPAPCPGPARR